MWWGTIEQKLKFKFTLLNAWWWSPHGNTLSWQWHVLKLIFNLLNKCISPNKGNTENGKLKHQCKIPCWIHGDFNSIWKSEKIIYVEVGGLEGQTTTLHISQFLICLRALNCLQNFTWVKSCTLGEQPVFGRAAVLFSKTFAITFITPP